MDKSHVTMEQQQCVVCCRVYDTGALLLDKRFRPVFERTTVTGTGLCPEHQQLHDDGYVALVEIDETRSDLNDNGTVKHEGAYRTGTVAHVRREAAKQIGFPDVDRPMVYVLLGVVQQLQQMQQESDAASM